MEYVLRVKTIEDVVLCTIEHYAYDCECDSECECDRWPIDFASIKVDRDVHYFKYGENEDVSNMIRDVIMNKMTVHRLLKCLCIKHTFPKIVECSYITVEDALNTTNRISGDRNTLLKTLRDMLDSISYFAYLKFTLEAYEFNTNLNKDRNNNLIDCHEVFSEIYDDLESYDFSHDINEGERYLLEV